MDLVTVIITLIAVGVILWLINMIPMDAKIKSILNGVITIVVVLWLLKVFHVANLLSGITIGK